LLLLLVLVVPVQAWDEEGHVLVSEIAWDQMSEDCRKDVLDILEHHPDSEVRTLGVASIWPDLVRDASHPFREHHRQDWHYKDRLIKDPTAGTQVKLGGQLMEQLERHTKILGDRGRSPAERALALSWITHLVGDIHQPLHNSELYDESFPTGDQGGNLFDVILGEQAISLHKLWDSAGGRFLVTPSPERLRSYQGWFQQAYPPEGFGELLQERRFKAWSDEGLVLAKEVYGDVRLGEPLERDVLQNVLDQTERRITLAGYRLAMLLERTLR
jgi:hypothetical protein